MSRRPAIALGLLVIGLALAIGVVAYRSAAPDTPYRPDFTLTDLSGTPRSMHEFDGDVVVLNFWASWCKPCREEIPMLVAAQHDYADAGLQVIGLAVDTPAAARAFARRYAIPYPILADATRGARIQDRFTGPDAPAGVLPFTVVIDRDGRIVARVAGALTRARLDKLVQPLLNN